MVQMTFLALSRLSVHRQVLSLGTCCTGKRLARKYSSDSSFLRCVSRCLFRFECGRSKVNGIINHHIGKATSEKYISSMGILHSKSSRNKKTGNSGMEEETIEAVVCQECDLQENEMKSFELNNEKILVVRQGGKFYALGNKCTHYNAPLDTGFLGEGRVRCPYHGACFNIATGDIEDFPGLDSLHCFKVEVENGGVKVRAKKNQLTSSRRLKPMTPQDENEATTFLIVGGGPAAQLCAETLRQEGFRGKIVMASKEPVLPYDRIKLSKSLDIDASKIALRCENFYKEAGIDLKLDCQLRELKTKENKALLCPGGWITYDSVFLATGLEARTLQGPGSDLKNIFVVRNVNHANNIAKELNKDKNLLVIGASFIGMECAAYCVDKVKSVTVVGYGSVPFEPVLGKEIGQRIMKIFSDKGIVFKMGYNLTALLPSESDASRVGYAELEACGEIEKLPVDTVIAGIGAVPKTDYLDGSGVETNRGFIPVNEFLATNVPNVFAGGDIAYAPVMGTNASIGHWQLASYHGRIGALNMLGKNQPMNTVPFFWTMFFGKGIRYAGYAPKFDDVVIHGDLQQMKFIAYFCNGNAVLAIATCGNDPLASRFAEHLSSGGKICKENVTGDPLGWTK